MLKNKKIIIIAIIGTVTLLCTIFGIIDYLRIKSDKYPIFCIKTENQQKFTENWWGLGYKMQRELATKPDQPMSESVNLRFGLWFYTKQINIKKRVMVKGGAKEDYVKQKLESKCCLYNVRIIAIVDDDVYLLANDGVPIKKTFHYRLINDDLKFVEEKNNDHNFRIVNTTNTKNYAIFYNYDNSLYRLSFDTLQIKEIHKIDKGVNLLDMYAYNNTIVLIYQYANFSNKMVHSYDINSFKEIQNEEVKSYRINQKNHSIYVVDINNNEKNITLE